MITTGNVSGGEIIDNKFISFTSTTEPQRSKLQELAIVLNEKIQLLTEKNEKTQSNGYGKTTKQRSTKSTTTKSTTTKPTTTTTSNNNNNNNHLNNNQIISCLKNLLINLDMPMLILIMMNFKLQLR